ncbi:hypothetical protein K8Q94_02145 [Candidatus Nomurabacteria bacterium]|nr:hypothetical protein [Candidatus Nomurabacteria bacterium]
MNDRFFFSSLRGTKIYIIHPGDVLVVRVYGATLNPNPVQESVVVRSEPWEKSPWFWIGGGLLLLTMLALAWVIGGRSRQFMGYGYYPYPTQPLPAPVAPQPQQGSYTHTHEHRFPPMTMNVVYTPTPAPVAPTASAKTEAGASAPASQ